MSDPVKKSDVSLLMVSSQVAGRMVLWNHYLHRRRVGKTVNYAVMLKNRLQGVLVFALPPVSGPMFGYKPGEIIELARVLFQDNPKNLGSCAIRMAVKKLKSDWPEAKAIVSWCDRSRFDGALYKATGFEYLGKSRVRGASGGRKDRECQPDRMTQKDIYLITVGK